MESARQVDAINEHSGAVTIHTAGHGIITAHTGVTFFCQRCLSYAIVSTAEGSWTLAGALPGADAMTAGGIAAGPLAVGAPVTVD